ARPPCSTLFPYTTLFRSLRCEARMTGVPGAEEFIDVEQIGYDDYEQQFHMGTLCTFGESHDLRGDWQNGQLLVKDDRESFEVRRSEEHTSELQSRSDLVC